MAVEQPKDDLKVGRTLVFLAFMGLIQLAGGLLVLSLIYAVVVILFRYAFHVELWNPFR